MKETSIESTWLSLLETGSLPNLGPRGRADAWSIQTVDAKLKAIPESSGLSPSSAGAIKSLVLLWHDHLDASHDISQSLHDENGSYIHGMMHRREPDYFNAKYWFRRVPNHPAFENFASVLKGGLRSSPVLMKPLTMAAKWDPFIFVDLCEKAATAGDESLNRALQEVQRLEFSTLLGWLVKEG